MIFYRLISYLPFPLLYATAWLGYLILYYLTGYRKAVVLQNLRQAFPERNASEITVLAKKFYLQLSQVALEIIKARRMKPADFRERVHFRNPEVLLDNSLGQTRSVIVLTIHQGNWEWLLHGATTTLGVPIDPVYKPLHNKTVDELIFGIRSQFGSRPLKMEESTRDILRRRKEFRVFVMVADQSPIRSERSYWTTFLNGEAAFYQGAESLAQLTGFPVLFVQCHRIRKGYYEAEFHELAQPPYAKGGHTVTDAYVARAERAIAEEPESWLWSNRRFKRNRATEEAALQARDQASPE